MSHQKVNLPRRGHTELSRRREGQRGAEDLMILKDTLKSRPSIVQYLLSSARTIDTKSGTLGHTRVAMASPLIGALLFENITNVALQST